MRGLIQQLQFLQPGWGDLIEILLVSYLVYRLLLLIQETRAMQMLVGVLLLGALYLISVLADFRLIRTLLGALLQYGAIAALVVFQPELRAALARLGQSRVLRLLGTVKDERTRDQLIEGIEQLSKARLGAIVAIQREVGLKEYAETGSAVGAQISRDLLTTIFSHGSPLHDGAVIVVGDMIQTAGAILPLSQNPVKDRSLGTRHRAAIGLSEETDAIVIVVSEETSRISVAYRGRLEMGVDADRLREYMEVASPSGKASVRLAPAV
ncbi:MAG: TIGR00159 family protein [Gemmatimonadetes bacterium]|nr:TIGR00159 family protein [Gemmatimonadota bacterium]